MKLSYFSEAAEEFGRRIWPLKEKLKIEELILRGTVAKKVENPVDLDMIILHRNPNLDIFQEKMRGRRYKTDQEAFYDLKNLITEVDLIKLLEGSAIEFLICMGLFHTSYMNLSYFTDDNYKRKWDSENEPKFPEKIFSEGLLWNPLTQRYDIAAKTKYQVPIIQQNPPLT